jgi:hypothetical protein
LLNLLQHAMHVASKLAFRDTNDTHSFDHSVLSPYSSSYEPTPRRDHSMAIRFTDHSERPGGHISRT